MMWAAFIELAVLVVVMAVVVWAIRKKPGNGGNDKE
jgi:hypothetical protein